MKFTPSELAVISTALNVYYGNISRGEACGDLHTVADLTQKITAELASVINKICEK